MAPSVQRTLLFDPEFEANLLKKLPQILPPLPSASLASLLHSDQPEDTSWKTQALPPSSAVHQAAENKTFNSPLMDTTIDTALQPDCMIYSPVLESTARAAVSHSSDLLPYQSVCELQLSFKDKETEAHPEFSSAQWLAPSDWSRGLLPPAEGLTCLHEWQDLAFKQGFMAAALTQTAEVAVKALKHTFHSAKLPACLPPSLASLETDPPRSHFISGRWDLGQPPG